MIVVAQLLLEAINAPAPSYSSNVGLAKPLGMPYWVSSGPIARIMTLFSCAGSKFGWARSTMKPPITTLSPVWTKARVLILPSVSSVMVGGVAAITRTLMSPTRQTATNDGRRSSFFILGGLKLRIFALDRFSRGGGAQILEPGFAVH